uniref:Transposase n=1 Tax=Candidatus Kentrum sp. FM TaxID=2126340 RepID=A0A450WUV7_9GAMM|nr:MAG: Transposase [Candidatus Kentron sp. FM]VFJ73948.1 MAG: Transposase [Candidatus Kentron sp. FM]VFK20845.1 MAG: Transposase [Candidatus Kentron sp. FM]
MFIRRTKTRNTKTGESYYTHRLVRSERVDGKVRQQTLVNLGRHFAVGQELWPALCAYVEQLLSAQEELYPIELPTHIQQEGQHILAQLTENKPKSQQHEGQEKKEDIQSVDVNSLQLVQPRSVGVEQAGLWAMEQLEFDTLIEGLGFSGPQKAALIGLIIARMAAPGSELSSYRWLTNTSALGELLDVDYSKMSQMQLYRASDLLMKHRETIEKHLFNRVSDLFGLSCTITLYDLTNTYFEGSEPSNPKAQRGRSKEKRTDCPLLTLGLVLDGSGFIRRSEVFAGNVSEANTLQSMLAGLQAPKNALVIMDRGVATEANLGWLRENGYRYLVVSRKRKRQFDPEQAITIENSSKEKIHLQKVISDDGQELRLYCFSEGRAKKEEGISKRFAQRFEQELEKISEGLSRPHTVKRLDKLQERIGRLKQKNHGIGQHYHIDLIPDDRNKNATALRWERKPVEGTMLTRPGVYCLRSNETGWGDEQMWRTYTMLTDLEAVFRTMKSEMGLRPIFHSKEERSDGHLFITVLAYQFVKLIRLTLGKHGHHGSWHSLRQVLAVQRRVTATFRRADGRTLHVRKATRPEPEQLAISRLLGLNPNPGGVSKVVH